MQVPMNPSKGHGSGSKSVRPINERCGVQVPEALMNNKYERALAQLDAGKDAKMRVFGNSMTPLIRTKSVVVYRRTGDYEVGDVVLVKIKGDYLTHKITKIDEKGRFMIANNKGRENGWVSTIYGRVVVVNDVAFGRQSNSPREKSEVESRRQSV